MMNSLLALAVISTSSYQVLAYPDLSARQDAHFWAAPAATDLRASCPGLNTLANHGYINRNGRGITKQQMQQGFLDAFGFAFDVTNPGGDNAVNLQNNGAGTFDLSIMNEPHAIEHDGSLSRNDLRMPWNLNADNHDFNATVWEQTLDLYGPITHIDVVSANTARLGRVAEARVEDFVGWFKENVGGSLAEHSFMLTSMNDPTVGTLQNPAARLDWVSYWLSNERLPTAIGWVKPTVPITGAQQQHVADAVAVAATTVPAPRVHSTSTSTSASTMTATIPKPTVAKPKPTIPVMPPYTNGTATTTTAAMSDKPTAAPTTTLPASVTSSAAAVATQLAGQPPAQPNAYRQTLTPNQWTSVKNSAEGYFDTIVSIVKGLCGAYGLGGMFMPAPVGGAGGAPAATGTAAPAPWYAPGPSGIPALSPAGPAGPAATCACN